MALYRDFLADSATKSIDAEGAVESVSYQCLKNGAVRTGAELLLDNLRRHANSARAHFGLGRAYRAAGREADALAAVHQARHTDPGLAGAKQALESGHLPY